MSVIGGEADMTWTACYVCLWPKADVAVVDSVQGDDHNKPESTSSYHQRLRCL